MQLYWEWGNGNLFTLWNRIIHVHYHKSSFRLEHKTAHRQSKLALKFSFTANMIRQLDPEWICLYY